MKKDIGIAQEKAYTNKMLNKEFSNKTKLNSRALSEQCLGCNLCVKQCRMLQNYNISPKEFFLSISEGQKVEPIIPFSCTLCGSCTKACQKNLRLQDVFMDMREDFTEQNRGRSPVKGHKAIEMHQFFSFSQLFNKSASDSKTGYTKRVFMPGCSLASYKPELVEKILKYLQNKLPGTGAVLKCCGKPTLSIGQTDKFYKRYSELEEEIYKLGATEVITACQNCFVTMSKYSPNLKIRSLWSVLPEIGLEEDMKGKGINSDVTFAIHDACPTRYNSEIHDGIRWIMEELGYKVEELQNNRENTKCCGFGGMILPTNPELSQEFMEDVAKEAKSQYMVTYCASCREAMAMKGKKAVHILELMFSDMYNSNSVFTAPPKSSIENWRKRYRSKLLIE